MFRAEVATLKSIPPIPVMLPRFAFRFPLAPFLLLLIAVALTAASCSDDSSTETTTSDPTTTTTTTPTTSTSTTTTIPTTTTTTIVLPDLPPHLAEAVKALIVLTEDLRGRTFLTTPRVVLDSRPAPPADDLSDYELAFLDLFNLVAPDTDLDLFNQRTDSALPFYQEEQGRIVLPVAEEPTPPDDPQEPTGEETNGQAQQPESGEEVDPEADDSETEPSYELNEYQRWALVGALTLALTHQHHPDLVDDFFAPTPGDDPDRRAAVGAVLTGEASLVQTLYLDGLPPERRAELAAQAEMAVQNRPAPMPPFLAELARFPSTGGTPFMLTLFRRGGTEALDRVLVNPPLSTEQVLHPDLYIQGQTPLPPAPFQINLEGYETVEEGTWGERQWRALLAGQGAFAQAAWVTTGWGGDRFQLLWNPQLRQVLFVARYAGDTFADSSRLAVAVGEMLTGLEVGDSTLEGTTLEWAGGETYALLNRQAGMLNLVVADDVQAGQQAAAQLLESAG